ncbi:hypothetical protein Cob_v011337 [Colletotrichum orbiculare MAFF 240422]|uniref:Uncharacterized protein n=1 Tax=Colletotrichum orbiculare (strain 104-T / ATCC 96160 / CBS 514.97 / LARS 414 / MAFF 240422) TaxID=1213857 RepID=A0A484FCL6_COLOR|nr:hypothetical protein Cob_v011337 [Colletotrichum orbiculare MAFF 240422]
MSKTLSERKALHVATLLGNGFYEWMVGVEGQRQLPVVNFTDVSDTKLMDTIIDEALLVDRDRFRAYLSHRHLGLGMITAARAWVREDNGLGSRRDGNVGKARPNIMLCPVRRRRRQPRGTT